MRYGAPIPIENRDAMVTNPPATVKRHVDPDAYVFAMLEYGAAIREGRARFLSPGESVAVPGSIHVIEKSEAGKFRIIADFSQFVDG